MPWSFMRKIFTVCVLFLTAMTVFPMKVLPRVQIGTTSWNRQQSVCYSPECTNAVKAITGISPRIAHIASDIAVREKVDVALVLSIINAESEGKINARSKVGAISLMQVMPFNYPGRNKRDLYIPEVNIKYGIKYLKLCLKTHRKRSDLWQYSAYNMGTNNKKLNKRYALKVKKFYDRLRPHVDRLVQLAPVDSLPRKHSQQWG